jgi:hypothetical protein
MPNVKEPQTKGRILRAVVLFLLCYVVFLIAWLGVDDYYARGVVSAASTIVTVVKDVRLEEITKKTDAFQATFSPQHYRSDILVDIPVKTSTYTFNSPLTFAILASLLPFLKKRRRAYVEAALLLLCVHILYVSSLQLNELTKVLAYRGLERTSEPAMAAFQFLWSFTDNMVIRFEPFLIGFYTFIRFRR